MKRWHWRVALLGAALFFVLFMLFVRLLPAVCAAGRFAPIAATTTRAATHTAASH